MEHEIFRDSPERKDKLLKAWEYIEKSGIEYVYMQFPSLTGRLQGKGIPAKHFVDMCEKGFSMVYGATVNVAQDRFGQYLGYPSNASELLAYAEPETLVQLPWDKRVARVFCTLFRNPKDREFPGQRLDADCRGSLRTIHQAFQAKHGLQLRAGMEPEMMWLRKLEGKHQYVGVTDPCCYHIGQFETLRPVYMKVLEYAQAMGLDMIQGDHEDAPGQLELNFAFDDVLASCDRLMTYRQICHQVAQEFNLVACFLPKPFAGVSGSGCHFNLSLWDGGRAVFREDVFPRRCGMEEVYCHYEGGNNVFLPSASDSGLTDIGKYAIGGIQKHLKALTAIAAPTVNSYKRLWETGFWAPVRANWGYQNRTCAIRVSAPDRVEYRTADSLVNPYLMAASLLKAMDDGLSNQYEPGPATDADSYSDLSASTAFVPRSLGQALEALDNDPVVLSALPGDMSDLFRKIKMNEWETFLATVTHWDFDTYLNHTP
ncbi:glutamine synthetase family protein [Pseudomonas alvandae]|jgi:glutamine synthetase|uniref:glutamine synthetase family protein n=1 Tax=Pseudomonas TaxID=286 RepID=UPI00389AC3BE